MEELTRLDFLDKIRTKYPVYLDIDDSTLYDAIMNKYPVYQQYIIEEKSIEERFPKPTITPETMPREIQTEKPSLVRGVGYGLAETGREQLRKLPETLLNLTTAGLSMSYLPRMLEDSKTAESRIKFWQQHTEAYGLGGEQARENVKTLQQVIETKQNMLWGQTSEEEGKKMLQSLSIKKDEYAQYLKEKPKALAEIKKQIKWSEIAKKHPGFKTTMIIAGIGTELAKLVGISKITGFTGSKLFMLKTFVDDLPAVQRGEISNIDATLDMAQAGVLGKLFTVAGKIQKGVASKILERSTPRVSALVSEIGGTAGLFTGVSLLDIGTQLSKGQEIQLSKAFQSGGLITLYHLIRAPKRVRSIKADAQIIENQVNNLKIFLEKNQILYSPEQLRLARIVSIRGIRYGDYEKALNSLSEKQRQILITPLKPKVFKPAGYIPEKPPTEPVARKKVELKPPTVEKLAPTTKEKIKPIPITTKEVKVAPPTEGVGLEVDLDKRMDSIVAKLDEKSGEFKLSEVRKEIDDLEKNKAELTEGLSDEDKAGIDDFITRANAEYKKTIGKTYKKGTKLYERIQAERKAREPKIKAVYLPKKLITSENTPYLDYMSLRQTNDKRLQGFRIGSHSLYSPQGVGMDRIWEEIESYKSELFEEYEDDMTQGLLNEIDAIQIGETSLQKEKRLTVDKEERKKEYYEEHPEELAKEEAKEEKLGKVKGKLAADFKKGDKFEFFDIKTKGFEKVTVTDIDIKKDMVTFENEHTHKIDRMEKVNFVGEIEKAKLKKVEAKKPAIKKEEVVKEPEIKAIVEKAGAEYKGIANGLVNFNITEGYAKGTTATIKVENATVENIKKHIAEKQKQFAPKEIPAELEPLAEEARKYKSGEEFKNKFISIGGEPFINRIKVPQEELTKYGFLKKVGKFQQYDYEAFYNQAVKEVKEITDYEKLSGLGKQVYRLGILSKTGGEFISNLKAKKISIETAKKELGTKSLGTYQNKIKKIELAKAHKIAETKKKLETEKRKGIEVTEEILGEGKRYTLPEAYDIIARHNAQLRKGQTPALSNEETESVLINAYRKAGKTPTTYEFAKDINKIYYNRKTGKSDLSLQKRRAKYKGYFKPEILDKIPAEGDKISIDRTFVIENTQGKKVKIPKGEEYMIYPHPTDEAKSIMQDGDKVTIWEGDLKDIVRNITILREGMIKAGGKIHKYKFKPEPKRPVLSEEQIKTMNRTKQAIWATVNEKGMNKTELYRDIIKPKTGLGKLTHPEMTPELLVKVLKSVKATRPKRIGYKTVIRPKTEKEIKKLKSSLQEAGVIDDKYWNWLLKSINIKESVYVDKKNFITESQGKALLKRMKIRISPDIYLMKFKEPGLLKYVTPKEYYLRVLGLEPLVKPIVDAKKMAYLEGQNINRWIRNITKRINKQAKTSIKEQAVSSILRKPTEAIVKMRDLLDNYETAPSFLSEEEQKLFNEIRGFTKSMLDRTNEVRKKLGLVEIKEVKAYITHYLDELAKQIIQKKYPFPEDVKYWLGRNLPKKIYNPRELERKIRKDLDNVFSKDLGRLLRALSRYDLRDIYLSEPHAVLRAELSAIGSNLPARTRRELDDFLRFDIFQYPTELDQAMNVALDKPTKFINMFLKPMNRIITNPIKTYSSIVRRCIIDATIWARPKLAIRNILTQKLLTMDLYPVHCYLKAQFLPDKEGMMDEIKKGKFYQLSIRKFEDIPITLKPEEWGMFPYRKSHAGINYLSNVNVAEKVGWYYAEEMIKLSQDKDSKYYKYALKYSKKHDVPLEKLLWNKSDKLAEAEEAGSLTQWLYFTTDMPQFFRGYTKRAMASLQSWWMNFYFKHMREAFTRTFTGRTSRGKLIKPSDRINWLKGTIIILGLLEGVRRITGLDYGRFLFLWGPAPAYLSPPGQLLVGLYGVLSAKTEWQRNKALRQMKYSWRAFIPGSMAWRDLMGYLHGEKTLKEFLFYTERGKKEKGSDYIPINKIGGG